MQNTDMSNQGSQPDTDRLFGLIQGHEDCFPWKTSEHFPQIVEKICSLWSNPAAIREYFEQLLLTQRETRQGFPQEVYTEIDRLSELYDKLHRASKKSKDDFWSWL